MSTVQTVVAFCYLLAAVGFVLGLHLMNSPATARRGNQLSAAGMALAVVATFAIVVDEGTITSTGWAVLGAGALIGGAIGFRAAVSVKMTAVPQLVSLFNAVGGGAAALIAVAEFVRLTSGVHSTMGSRTIVATVLDVVIGAVTFSGSLVAAGKLQGWITGNPIVFPGARVLNAALAAVAVAGGGYLISGSDSGVVFTVVIVVALFLGVTMVLPIGGADMPVVISLLNALTGTAVAMAGFVIDNSALIIAGALVGASGGILTKLMADAMNRSIGNIVIGGFGTGDTESTGTVGPGGDVRRLSAEHAAIQLVFATNVIIVPGYGLAAAQAQHRVRELADLLEDRGVEVSFAIHPVAGRMPGHMNVLLAEADVPYNMLKEMDEINAEFQRADVALVIGANDVINPAARRPGNAVSGMPILDVDQAKNVIVIKRSMGHGYAGIDNELYVNPKTGMFFADAKEGLREIIAAANALVGTR
jgi:H+-translocating NAD(P) transhydrogenase subunit beta